VARLASVLDRSEIDYLVLPRGERSVVSDAGICQMKSLALPPNHRFCRYRQLRRHDRSSQLHEIIPDALAIEAQGWRRIIMDAVWSAMVADIVTERSNAVLISADQVDYGIAPADEAEVKVGPDRYKDQERSDDLPCSKRQGIHMQPGIQGLAQGDRLGHFSLDAS
jgi:hypothetical protein